MDADTTQLKAMHTKALIQRKDNGAMKYKSDSDLHNPNFDYLHFDKTYVVEQRAKDGEVIQQVTVMHCAGPVDAICKAKLVKTSHYRLGYKPVTVHVYPLVYTKKQTWEMGEEERHGMTPAVEDKDTV